MRTTVALGVGKAAITAEHLPFTEDIGVYVDDDTAGAMSLLLGPEQAQQLADALARLGIRADPEPMGGAA